MTRYVGIAIVVVGLAACGSSSKTSVSASTPTTQRSATSTTMNAMNATSTTAMGGGMNDNNAACKEVGDMAMAKTTVNVTLKEWSVSESLNSVGKGTTHFAVKNTGTEKHELAIVKGTSLPTKANGAVDETMLMHGELLGRVAVPAGQGCDITVDLPAGTYTLMCNLVEQMGADMGNELHVHYAKGMHTTLTVSA